jgi:hypothetical protein
MRRVLVILLLSLTCGAAAPSPSTDPVEELMHARSFCMGCEAFAGRIISGDDAFMAVLKRKTAAPDLQRAFEHGTREAKMYALAGLREIDPPRFESDFATLRTGYGSITVVLTENPPSILRRSADEVLRDIRAGRYRGHVQWIRTGRFSR